ncbi:MAG: ABC transporter permease [bacterium]
MTRPHPFEFLRHAWLKLYRYLHIARYQAYASLRSEIEKNCIGMLWWFLEPLINALTLYFVFTVLFKNRDPKFLPFLLVGTFVFQWFSTSVSMSMTSIIGKLGLLQQVYLPKILLPLISILNSTWKFLCAFSALLLFFTLLHTPPHWTLLALPLIMLAQFLFILGVSLPLAALIPYFRDGATVVDAFMRLLMFVSGVFFTGSSVPGNVRGIFYLNPVAVLIEAYRAVVLQAAWPNWGQLGYVCGIGLGLSLVGLFILDKLDLALPKVSP